MKTNKKRVLKHSKTRKQKNRDPYKNTDLYPRIKPLKSYKMKVSNIHTISVLDIWKS
jgi:hypothetical protein